MTIFSTDTMKVFLQGALGSLTFGMYHYYLTSKMIEMTYNENYQQHQYDNDEHQNELNELRKRIDRLEKMDLR